MDQNGVSQVLRPDMRLEIPQRKVRPPDRGKGSGGGSGGTQPAPVSLVGSCIAEIKVISKGVQGFYKVGSGGRRAVEARAAQIPAEYMRKAKKMDSLIDKGAEEGPCAWRLKEFGLLRLVLGAYGEGSEDVHRLIAALAECRVRTLTLRGEKVSPHQLGLEKAQCSSSKSLVARLSQIGEGGGLASRRREMQREEEREMSLRMEADWAAKLAGQEIVRRGRFWSS